MTRRGASQAPARVGRHPVIEAVLRRRGDLVVMLATVVGLAPGFMVPFVASIVLDGTDADVLLLGYAIAQFLMTVVGVAVEANTVAEYGRHPSKVMLRLSSNFGLYLVKVVAAATLVALVAVPALMLVYGAHLTHGALSGVVLPFAVTGVAAAVSASFSGVTAARGGTAICVASYGLRAIPALATMAFVPHAGPALIAWSFLAGEVLRCVVLAVVARRREVPSAPDPDGRWQVHGALWQTLASSGSQISPTVDRYFLTMGGVGNIAAYEIADKAYYAGYQLMTGGLLLKRMAGWGDLSARGRQEAQRIVLADARTLVGMSLVVAPATIGAILVGLALGVVPDSWSKGLTWSVILCAGLPLGILQLLGSRLLVTLRQQWKLMPLTVVGIVANFVLDLVFFWAWGPVGIVISTLGTKLFAASAYGIACAVALRKLPATPETHAVGPAPTP